MHRMILKPHLTDKQLDARASEFLDEKDYDVLIGNASHPDPIELSDADTGVTFAVWVPNKLESSFVKAAFVSLSDAASSSTNRGIAAGSGKHLRVRADGSVGNTFVADKVLSSVVGYFDRYPRMNYCRSCAWNYANPDKWQVAVPMIQKISQLFAQYCPEKYRFQAQYAAKIKSDWIIPGTVFSTVTVNKNFRTALHRDGLNLAGSFSAFNVMRVGNFLGGHLVLPRYRIAFNCDNGDVLFFAPQEPHGNCEMKQMGKQKFERLSLVYYVRDKLIKCGTMAEELERGKNLHGGL